MDKKKMVSLLSAAFVTGAFSASAAQAADLSVDSVNVAAEHDGDHKCGEGKCKGHKKGKKGENGCGGEHGCDNHHE